MDIASFISQLRALKLFAECTQCGEEFPLSKSLLFDGSGNFPEPTELLRKQMLEDLQVRLDALKQRKISAGPSAEKRAIEVGIGKIIEKVIPSYKNFGVPISDCRPLFEPIDMIIFHGLSTTNIKSITFMEIKIGQSRLNQHQKLVKEAISDSKVSYQVI